MCCGDCLLLRASFSLSIIVGGKDNEISCVLFTCWERTGRNFSCGDKTFGIGSTTGSGREMRGKGEGCTQFVYYENKSHSRSFGYWEKRSSWEQQGAETKTDALSSHAKAGTILSPVWRKQMKDWSNAGLDYNEIQSWWTVYVILNPNCCNCSWSVKMKWIM